MKRQHTDITKFPISPLAKAGLLIKNMAAEDNASEHDHSKPHRDDHYLFMIATGGHFVIDIDFEKNIIIAPSMVLICPGQIHHIISASNPSGWGMSIDPSLIGEEFQLIMEKGFLQPISIDKDSAFFGHAISLMEQMEKLQKATFHQYSVRVIHSIFDAMIGLIAGEIALTNTLGQAKANRAAIIVQDFIQLLKKHYREWKQPAQYAGELNISVAHLYATIKPLTGDSVSAYIQQYCIREAKRLLCFSKLTVKEISYELGYEEPIYFGKLFKKITGFTPLQFRKQYLD